MILRPGLAFMSLSASLFPAAVIPVQNKHLLGRFVDVSFTRSYVEQVVIHFPPLSRTLQVHVL